MSNKFLLIAPDSLVAVDSILRVVREDGVQVKQLASTRMVLQWRWPFFRRVEVPEKILQPAMFALVYLLRGVNVAHMIRVTFNTVESRDADYARILNAINVIGRSDNAKA